MLDLVRILALPPISYALQPSPFNPHEPQLPFCSAAQGGVNLHDAFICLPSASHLPGIHMWQL